jgi:GNAT superfamily N-acetyltransferase
MDLEAMLRLYDELEALQRPWRVFAPRVGFRDEVSELFRVAMASPDQVVLVAEDDGEVIGMTRGEIRPPSSTSDDRALALSAVVVRADRRGRGAGRALMSAAARFADSRGVPHLELRTFWPNREAVGFWRSVGFTPRLVQLTAPTASVARALEDREID